MNEKVILVIQYPVTKILLPTALIPVLVVSLLLLPQGNFARSTSASWSCTDVDFNANKWVGLEDITQVVALWRARSGDGGGSYEVKYDVFPPGNPDGMIHVRAIMYTARFWGPCGTTPFGVQTFGELGDATLRARVQGLGLQWARIGLGWKSVEPNEPVNNDHSYQWNAADALINNVIAAGLNPIVVIGQSPQWAVQNMPVNPESGQRYDCGPIDEENLEDFASFVTALVERYDGDGYNDAPGHPVVRYWEFWNEPDNQSTAPECIFVQGCWGGDLDSDGVPDPQEYARMLSYAYSAVKRANPEAQVLFGAVAYETSPACFNFNFMDQVLDAFSLYPGADFDLANLHQYDYQRELWDGNRPFYQGVLGKAVRPVDAGGSSRLSIKSILANHGLSKPIVVSELGLATGGRADHRELQAQHLIHEMVRGLSVSNEIPVLIWFTLRDFGDGSGWGLVARDAPYNPHPAYYAYQTLIQQLSGYEFVRQLAPSETGSVDIQGYVFAKAGAVSNKVVLWRDTGKPIKRANTTATSTMVISAAQLGTWTGRVRIVDKYGNVSTKSGSSSVSISFTTDPIFVEANP